MLDSLAGDKVHKTVTVKFAGGTAKKAKSAKRIVRSETSASSFDESEISSGLGFMPLASLAVQSIFLGGTSSLATYRVDNVNKD
jgi:hypothetical protein